MLLLKSLEKKFLTQDFYKIRNTLKSQQKENPEYALCKLEHILNPLYISIQPKSIQDRNNTKNHTTFMIQNLK